MEPITSPELLDDFFAECDEHLVHIRQDLVTLEASVDRAQPEAAVVEDLFRNFHSFKGISAIVGLTPAEKLAHGTEDFLRDLQRGNTTLSHEGLELLAVATQKIEQIVAAFRAGQPMPEMGQILEQIGKITKKPLATIAAATVNPEIAETPKKDLASQIEAQRGKGMLIWRAAFSPTHELDQRGVNVNTVRTRLATLGEIFHAEPKIQGEGKIAFEFLVAMREAPADLTTWDADAILLRAYEQPQASENAIPVSAAPSTPFLAPSHFVRVDLSRLDELMRITGEMVIQRSRFEEQINRSFNNGGGQDIRPFQELSAALGRTLRELREAIMRVRLVPVAEIFSRMPFVVRDLARESGKKVRLALDGQQTEVDKYLVEQLKDPLLHIVRNSVSHGVESATERIAAGKPEEATIRLSAAARGDSVIIEVSDDGRGVDLKSVRRRAESLGLPVPAEFDNAALLALLCAPGFSTRDEADRASGRGVGMAVVQNTIREMGGILAIETHPGQGCKFTLRFPLTLAIADAFIVSVAGQVCAVPQSFVQEVMQLQNTQLRTVDSVEVIPYRGGILPLLRLSTLFGLPINPLNTHILVLQSENGSKGLVVDRIHGHREIVVRAIRDPLVQSPEIAAATELGDGRPVLILNAAVLTSGAIRPPHNN